MRAVVIYESMYGNTRRIAESVAAGLDSAVQVSVYPVGAADAEALDGADLIVLGGPTHAWSMSKKSTRDSAIEMAEVKGLVLDADAGGPGLREWISSGRAANANVAAFDTRLKVPSLFTGRASVAMARQLRHHGGQLVTGPKSFYVDRRTRLCVGEEARARAWGASLAVRVQDAATVGSHPAPGDHPR